MAEYVLFGNVGMKRAYCASCDGNALVLDGKLQCCDRVYAGRAGRVVRECQPEQRRKGPRKAEKLAILANQKDRCLYCEQQFGSNVLRRNRVTALVARWDHVVPFNYSQDNSTSNFVAACQICNGIKGDKCFDTVEDARIHVRGRRQAKGYFPS